MRALYLLLPLCLACGPGAQSESTRPLPKNAGSVPSDSGAGPATSAIRAVDWNNRTYRFPPGGALGVDELFAGEYPVVDGAYTWDRGGGDRGWFVVDGVVYGDVDGDGAEDAIVTVTWNGGGSGKFDTASVYVARGNEAVLIGQIPGGDRASGGLRAIRAVDGSVVVERYVGDAACCPEKLRVERWSYDGTAMVEEPAPRR